MGREQKEVAAIDGSVRVVVVLTVRGRDQGAELIRKTQEVATVADVVSAVFAVAGISEPVLIAVGLPGIGNRRTVVELVADTITVLNPYWPQDWCPSQSRPQTCCLPPWAISDGRVQVSPTKTIEKPDCYRK